MTDPLPKRAAEGPGFDLKAAGKSSDGLGLVGQSGAGDFKVCGGELRRATETFASTAGWDQRKAQAEGTATGLKREIKEIEVQTDRLLARIVETDNPAVVSAYEKKIAECEGRKLLLAERLASSGRPQHAFEDVFELAMRFLSNPWNIWASGQLPLRRMVLRLAFAERVPYRRGEGFSNAKTSLPFSILREVGMGEKVMARPTGIEPVFSP